MLLLSTTDNPLNIIGVKTTKGIYWKEALILGGSCFGIAPDNGIGILKQIISDASQFLEPHTEFAKNNIPVIFYFNGVHEDYHKATDTVEKIDFEKIQTITRLVFLTAWELANRDERIVVDKK